MPATPERICYIHAGTHKTASTYIQSRLRQNRRLLNNESLIYDFPRRSGLKHKPLIKAINREKWKKWHHYLDRFETGSRNMLMSAEQFTRPLCNPHQLRRITKILRNHGFGLHVIVFIRPQLEYMNSRYVHTLRRLYHCLNFDDYVNQSLGAATGDIYNYNEFFQPLLQSGVPCTFIPFSRRYGDPFLQLIGALKINPDLQYSSAAPGSENVQPGTKGVWLSRLVVERIQALGFNGRTLKNTSQMVRSVAEKEGWHEDRYFGFSPQLAETTINHYRAGNDAFALQAWNLPWQEVFSTEIPPQSIYTPPNDNESDRMNLLAEQIVARLATTNSQLSVALNATA